jgi:hypothetical protein
MTDFIEIYPDTLPANFCQEFIHSFDQSPYKNMGRTGGGVDINKKLSQDIYLNQHIEFQHQLAQITQACTSKIIDYMGKYFFSLIGSISLVVEDPRTNKPVQLTEENFNDVGKPNILNLIKYLFRLAPINAQKYTKNEGNYKYWHSEIFPQQGHNDALHRTLLILIYLNDVDEGGETEFYYQNKSIRPKAGSMIIAPCGFTHTHRGNIPKSSNKYVLTSWVLFNPAERIYTPK